MKNFLKDKKGETLVETMAAILIFTMASIALYTMVTTATDLNYETNKVDKEIQNQLIVAERAESGDPCTVSVEIRNFNNIAVGPVINEQGYVYHVNDSSLYSYSR